MQLSQQLRVGFTRDEPLSAGVAYLNERAVVFDANACYGAPYGCYDALTYTTQLTGIPAAGQGDSGGPVYVASGNIQAAGFISGISGATTTCTGDAGGRLCSSVVMFAPIMYAFAGGYSLNIIP